MAFIPRLSGLVFAVCVLGAFVPSTAVAAFATGDIAVITEADPGSVIKGDVKVYASDGTFRGFALPSSGGFNPAGVVFTPAKQLFVADHSAAPARSATNVYDAVSQPRVARLPIDAVSYSFDAAGAVYAAPVDGERLVKYSAAGALLATYEIAGRSPDSIDLGADQCTLFYTFRDDADFTGRIGSYDVCANAPKADLGIVLPAVSARRALRVLRDGSLLVTVGDSSVERPSGAWRISTNGIVLQTYTFLGPGRPWLGLALDPSGTSFWVALVTGGTSTPADFQPSLLNIDIASGAALAGPYATPTTYLPRAIAVSGEARAALLSMTAVPTVSPLWMMLIAAALALLATQRLS